MLDQALEIIAARLNGFISQRVDIDEDIVEIASPVSPDGVMPVEANDKILIFVANISKDTLPYSRSCQTVKSGIIQSTEALYLNIHISIAANFHGNRYVDALSFLSMSIQCLHENPVLDRFIIPDIPTQLEKLIIEIENTDLNEVSNLWGMLGGKYLPSIFYKVRMLTIKPEGTVARVHTASNPQALVGN
ncbi:DUF4255 domain-containing protein [Teredinibacter haidensis]|uniref:DUF4255 domain-containing protein n=1 Tax=Teredinibacter haidensis TaxID=2731755 RepID=UPI000948924F|nr:DUF4255 domain-containing protein [Teredinibacter haidensis]